jgi:hypothetical protein
VAYLNKDTICAEKYINNEEYNFLCCNAVQFGQYPTFRRKNIRVSQGRKQQKQAVSSAKLLVSCSDPKNGGNVPPKRRA